jgi:LmbE family N-acetylglucosaminyl deacetylase
MPSLAAVERVLVITAHPDDAEWGAGGTIALWTEAGLAVTYCVVTNGDAGGPAHGPDGVALAEVRQAEQRAAAAELGVQDVRFLGYQDGRVEASLGLRRDLARVLREVRPDRLLTHSPERNYERVAQSHPDHRAVGSAALDAVYPDARNTHAFPELAAAGLAAWAVPEVWLRGGPTPNHFVDITTVVDRKVRGIRAHASQPAPAELDTVIRSRLADVGLAGGLPSGRMAESFQVISTA